MADASIKEVMAFFGMTAQEFTKEWRKMSQQDKEELRRGIGDGSLTY